VAKGTKAGYRGPMAAEAFCTTCQRMVYIEEGETAVCPVCSSPLLESTQSPEEDQTQPAEESAL
jgi:DNA-directed RNA polymerase subunit RPC12/RpoP